METQSVTNRKGLPIPEFSLAVSICMWPDSELRTARVSACLSKEIDWAHFLRVVDRHRIAGLTNHALVRTSRDRVPAGAALALKKRAESQARLCLRTAAEAAHLATLLEQSGIPCVMFKGASLAMLAYQNLALRHSKDNDILVSPLNALRADSVLISAGYKRTMPETLISERHIEIYMRYRSQFQYLHPQTGLLVDLHWRLQENRLFGLQIDPVVECTPRLQVNLGSGLHVNTLNEDDLLTYLCAHGAKHAWFRLKWLVDIEALLAKDHEAASRLLMRSQLQGTERAAMQALLLCHQFWNTPLPAQMHAANWPVRHLVRTAYAAMTAGGAIAEPQARRFDSTRIYASHFFLSSSLVYLWRECMDQFMLPDDWDKLPAGIRFLYPLLRVPIWVVNKLRHRKPKSLPAEENGRAA